MEWISVKHKLPEDGQDVLAIIYNEKFFVPFSTQYRGNGEFRTSYDDEIGIGDYSKTISHWMPLPEPPQD